MSSDATLPQTTERRAYIRYARRLETLWTLLGFRSVDLTSGEMFDISASGIGLRIPHEFPTGTSLVLRLQSATLGWASYLVKVRHCHEIAPGQYQIGCSFVKPLTAVQLHELLSGPQIPPTAEQDSTTASDQI